MKASDRDRAWDLLQLLFKAHPWHGVAIGPEAPAVVTVYVEIVPSDTVKFEIDKQTGLLKVDRPQQFSNVSPTLYGFLPQTYCGPRLAALARARTGREEAIEGDGDPLDICVLTENAFPRGDVLLRARPIGGLLMLDGGEADDKILAVLQGDLAFGEIEDITELPQAQIDRLKHYFLTYKSLPNAPRQVEITHVYGRAAAHEVIERSREDYAERFPDLKERLLAALAGE